MISLLLSAAIAAGAARAPLRYTVDLSDRATHTFSVVLRVDSLPSKSDVFQFAATAPGTYQVMDVGRFVSRFTVYDKAGKPIPAEQVSTNQWRISAPRAVREIRYNVKATRDTTVMENTIYAMCGSALRAAYAQINGQALFGYPLGMQTAPLSVTLTSYPSTWKVGTALDQVNGAYQAESYDHLVDSPILLGELTTSRVNVTGVPVEIYVYSAQKKVTATQLAGAMTDMLNATGKFLGKLPVDRYTFLYDFGPFPQGGAWEHSYSSEYVLFEGDYTPQFGARVTDIAAHEFFHIVTPLNIHSEIIEHFNFTTPVPSKHLWLYEGTTEWAAHKLQLEAKLKTAEQYMTGVIQKSRADHLGYDTTYSLVKLALTSYSDSGQRQYGNIYSRGAIVAGLLDIALLEQSNGAHGYRDLINDLARTYGKHRAFPDDSLFAIVERRTSPEVGDFLRRYVQSNEHPPLKEYYAKLGIRIIEDEKGLPVRFEIDPNPTPAQLRLRRAWLGEPVAS